jgi:hypothetical protein
MELPEVDCRLGGRAEGVKKHSLLQGREWIDRFDVLGAHFCKSAALIRVICVSQT